jgi:acetyltransferase-like isoleucine patch superfamily enzyme
VSDDRLMPIHDPELLARGERVLGPEFRAMSARVLEVTALTSRLNLLPFDDEVGRASLLEQILGRPLPATATVYPPFYTDHGLRLDLGQRVFVNQGCTFLDYAGIRLGEGVLVGPRATFITIGHPVDPGERRQFLSGAPIDVAANAWIGAGATILPGVSIGRDAVVAAGTVVADDVPEASLVAGPKGTVRRRWQPRP